MGKQIPQRSKAQKKIDSKKSLDVGLQQKTLDIRKGKTHKGRKILENRAAKVVENPKTAIFIKGNKSSLTVNQIMKELHIMRGQDDRSKLFMKKSHDIHPFENQGPLELLAGKQDCSLICFGNHQKKRPDNLILGRTYDKRILDVFEFGVLNFKSMNEFDINEVSREQKPVLVFQGEQFEFSEKHQRIKNLLYEFFHMNDMDEVNIVEMKRILVFTSLNETDIQVRQFEIPQISEPQVLKSMIDMKEIGPRFDLKLRRAQVAAIDLYKLACRKPKVLNPDKKRVGSLHQLQQILVQEKCVYYRDWRQKSQKSKAKGQETGSRGCLMRNLFILLFKAIINQQLISIYLNFKNQKQMKNLQESNSQANPPNQTASALNKSSLNQLNSQSEDYGAINEDSSLMIKHTDEDLNCEKQSDYSLTDTFPKTEVTLTTANIVKSFVGLGILAAPYGFYQVGYLAATIMILLNGALNCYTVYLQSRCKEQYGRKWQIFACSGYIKFFIQQMDQVINYMLGENQGSNQGKLFFISFLILAPLSLIQSMKNISYISITAIFSIGTALIYIVYTDIQEINSPTFDKNLIWLNIEGIPYFFGIAMFMFEGNAVAIEIHHQMEDAQNKFVHSLGLALGITASLILLIGCLSYSAYGQFTNGIILLNLKPSLMTYLVQIFYSIGIICSYCLQIIPTFKVMKLIPIYQQIPESKEHPMLKTFLTRITVAFICCLIAYIVPDLGQLLNFQGAIIATLLTFIFPISFYFKTFSSEIGTKERYFCYGIIVYGTIGGFWSTICSIKAMFA
ncbi:brix domain-containing protein 1 [Stylonychia lemnae]|uniref:Ribosome production factor 2 homolog n=1 Tax=Stylonychia lemnae TaxID=5949 RepID=A0A078AF05_STYLE|nr:brix domain-containing protein 1 [Stylonychia lemnae]|eukprot:CDW79488.1 brix domain-containing protein 1 [Stylonychia lemnae]